MSKIIHKIIDAVMAINANTPHTASMEYVGGRGDVEVFVYMDGRPRHRFVLYDSREIPMDRIYTILKQLEYESKIKTELPRRVAQDVAAKNGDGRTGNSPAGTASEMRTGL